MNAIIRGQICESEIVLSASELSARLGRPSSVTDSDVENVCREIFKVANMRFAVLRLKVLSIEDNTVTLEGFSVASSALASYFSGTEETYIFAATLGGEVDRLIMKKKALSLSEGFLFDAVASALTEAVCDAAEKKISLGETFKNRFSPGYADCPLSVQRDLLGILCADKHIGIKLLDSLLMAPMKSVSAFVAIKEKNGN